MNELNSRGDVSSRRRGRIRDRLVQIALVLGLVIISSVTVAAMSPGGPLWGAVGTPPTTTVPPPAETKGTLTVTIDVNSGPSPPVPCLAGFIWNTSVVFIPEGNACAPQVFPRNVTFSAVQQGVRFPERHFFRVPVPGSKTISVGAGNYSIIASNAYFNMSLFASVGQTATTDVIVNVSNTFIVPRLTEAVDRDLSGAVGPWGQVEMLLQKSNDTLYVGEPVYLQTNYYPQINYYLQANYYYPEFTCSPCKVNPFLPSETTLALVTRVTKSPGGYWAVFAPRSLIDLQNINGAWIVLVSSSYRVVQGV